jgi:hypothetical protein
LSLIIMPGRRNHSKNRLMRIPIGIGFAEKQWQARLQRLSGPDE